MKTLTIIFVVSLGLAVSWGLGYRTGTLDEGMAQREKIERLEEDLANYDEAFRDAYGKFVACVRAGE